MESVEEQRRKETSVRCLQLEEVKGEKSLFMMTGISMETAMVTTKQRSLPLVRQP